MAAKLSKNQGKENIKPGLSCHLRTYNQVAALKADVLKKLCTANNIDVKFPKKAKILFLCHALGISTTGAVNNSSDESIAFLPDSIRKEYEELNLKFLSQINEWTTDFHQLPEFEESSIKAYLLRTNVLTSAAARTYKVTRPFQLKQFVHSLLYFSNKSSSCLGVLRAFCNPSQSTCADEVKVVFVIFDKITGEPYGGFCTCTVGNVQTCGHVGAVLFSVADLLASGILDASCTEQLCKWTDPKGSKCSPSVFCNIKIQKTEKVRKRTAEEYGQFISKPSQPDPDAVLTLKAQLIEATHHTGQYCPAIHVLNPDRFRNTTSKYVPLTLKELPDKVDYHCSKLAYSYEEEVSSTPITIVRVPHGTFKSKTCAGYVEESYSFFKFCKNMNIDVHQVERLTRGQSSNKEWHLQRQCCITATKCHEVIRVFEGKKKAYNSLVSGILNKSSDNLKNVPAIKWGRKYETKAIELYTNKFAKYHSKFTVNSVGLKVFDKCHFIRGSPDGIVSCACHDSRLLEVKCPYSARMLTVSEAVSSGKIKYLKKENGKFYLKEDTADGYYAQVQCLMGICSIQLCNFVVWTTRDMITVVVPYNKDYFETKIVPASCHFFKEIIIPKLFINESAQDEDDLQTPCLNIPSINPTSVENSTFAEAILEEIFTAVPLLYNCGQCKKVLPEDNILPDNSNASVGCDCPNCGGCDTWFCWPCARYDKDWLDEGIDWYCPNCVRHCDIVY